MKTILSLIVSALLFAACSSPKYSYHFDHYNYNSGKKQTVAQNASAKEVEVAKDETSPLLINNEAPVEASAKPSVVITPQKTNAVSVDQKTIAQKISSLSKTDRKGLKNELKRYIKDTKKSGATVNATKVMDHDLRLAAIFGAVGLVLTLLGGVNSVFWILGVIALVIGVVFFIKWIARQ